MGVSHPNLLCLKDTFDEDDGVYLVLELAPEGELFNWIVMKQKLTEVESRKVFVQLFQAVKYLVSSSSSYTLSTTNSYLHSMNETLSIATSNRKTSSSKTKTSQSNLPILVSPKSSARNPLQRPFAGHLHTSHPRFFSPPTTFAIHVLSMCGP
jgi:Protein kinase domain